MLKLTVCRQDNSINLIARTGDQSTGQPEITFCHYPNCRAKFRAKLGSGNLTRHIKSVHTPLEKRDKSLHCEICGSWFSRKDGKTVHNQRKHPKEAIEVLGEPDVRQVAYGITVMRRMWELHFMYPNCFLLFLPHSLYFQRCTQGTAGRECVVYEKVLAFPAATPMSWPVGSYFSGRFRIYVM